MSWFFRSHHYKNKRQGWGGGGRGVVDEWGQGRVRAVDRETSVLIVLKVPWPGLIKTMFAV